MLQVQITQQNVKARLNVQDPFLQLKTTDPQVQISSQPLKMEISSPAAEVQIDNYPCDRSRGILNNVDFDRQKAQKGMQAMQNFISKLVREGNMLARIESHGQLAQLAREALAPKSSEITLASVAEPSIRVTPHEAKVHIQPAALNISFKNGTANGSLQKGTVGLSMLQYPEASFRFIDKRL